jgi:hypothetical protein
VTWRDHLRGMLTNKGVDNCAIIDLNSGSVLAKELGTLVNVCLLKVLFMLNNEVDTIRGKGSCKYV